LYLDIINLFINLLQILNDEWIIEKVMSI
jgi:hypothetical protein